MGKTKIATIDDSVQEEVKEKSSKKKETLDDGNSKLDLEAGSSKLEDQPSNIQPQNLDSSIKSPTSKSSKPGKANPRSKKYQEVVKDLDRSKAYSIPEAVEIVKKISYSKFSGTLEAHINTAQTGIRGLVSLPYSSGKKLRILVFGAKTPIEDTISGDESTIESILKGKVDFDLVITTPDWMPKLAKAAKVLGPRGLMPNPKNGTITDDLKKTVEGFQAGKTEFKTEAKARVIHLGLGKLNQPTEELSANIKTLLQTIGKTKIRQVRLAPTMGPSVKIELSNTFS